MYGISDYVAQLYVAERRQNALRSYERRRLVRIAQARQQKNIRQLLQDFIHRIRHGTLPPEVVDPSEKVLNMAEVFGLSPEELRREEAKHLLYEPMTRGHALVEIERRERRLREGKS